MAQPGGNVKPRDIIVIGTSAGGFSALKKLLNYRMWQRYHDSGVPYEVFKGLGWITVGIVWLSGLTALAEVESATNC